MKRYFIVDSLFIRCKLIFAKAVIFTVLRYSKMLYISNFIPLTNNKVGSIRLASKLNVVFVKRLVFVIDIIQIQEVGNLHLLIGTHNFALNSYRLLGTNIHYLLLKLIQITAQGGKIRFRYLVEEVVEVIPLVWSIEIGRKEQYQIVDEAFILQN